MAFHNPRLLSYSLIILFHSALSQPSPSPSPAPTAVPASAPSPVLAPVPAAARAPAPSPGLAPVPAAARAPAPSPGLAPVAASPGPAAKRAPAPSPGPASVPAPAPSPGLVPEAASPGPAAMRAPAPSPGLAPVAASPGPAAMRAPAPSLGPASVLAPVPSPPWGSAPSLSPSLSPSISMPPSSSMAPSPSEYDYFPYQVDSPTTLAPSTNIDPKVKKICEAADHPSLCVATVVPLLDGKSDITSVLEVTMKAGAKLAEHALSEANKSAEQPDASAEHNFILNSCKEDFQTAVTNYKNAISAFPGSNKGTMNYMLSEVMTAIGDCEDAFSVIEEKSPFSSISLKLTNMTRNCLSIISQLD